MKKTVAGVSTYYHYSSTKRLYSTTGGEPLTCAYNSSGHLTSGSMNGTSYGLTYDGFNQVRTIQLDSLTELEAGYDGDGLRVMKSGYYGTTIYHYDPAGNVLSENDDNGQKIADYVYLNGKLIAKVAVNAGSQEERYYYHTDQTGTVLAISNAAGQKVWEADYKPFGEEYNIIASKENTKRFAGKEKDIETGLNYFGARYLYAGIGRFLAPDPVRAVDTQSGQINAALLVNPQRHNVYAYSLNNPYRYVDPDGRSPKDRSLFSGGGMGGAQGTPSFAGMDRYGNLRPIAKPSRSASEVSVTPKNGIKTPYGVARQSDNAAALAARTQIEKGATLYRIGTRGKSQAAEAQFWALEHPNTPGFAQRYGIPAENVQNANFIETATVKPGTSFITRPAPGVGSNMGGGVEVVVPTGGVQMKSFNTP